MVLVESVERVVFKWFKSCWAKLNRCCLISTSSCLAFKSDSAVAKYDLSISSCKFFHSTLWSTSWEVSKTIMSMCYKNWISHNVYMKKWTLITILTKIFCAIFCDENLFVYLEIHAWWALPHMPLLGQSSERSIFLQVC